MSYTYPQALDALQSVARDFLRILRPNDNAVCRVVPDAVSGTASVQWDAYYVTIHMPVLPATSVMTQTEFENWTSYVLHEMGHPTFTDLTVWQNACNAGLGRLTNAIEDVRMEAAIIASGVVPNAKRVLSRLVARKVAEARGNKWKPNARSEIAWTLCVLGRAANGYAIDPDDLAWIKAQIVPGSTVSTVLAWALPDLAGCTDTADCLALARRIAAAIATPAPQAPIDMPINPNPGAGAGDQGEGEEGEGEGEEGEGEGEGEGESEGEGEGEGKGETGSQGAGEPADASEGEGEGNDGADGETRQEAPQGPQDTEGAEGGKGGKGHGDGSTDEKPVKSETDLAEHDLAPSTPDALTGYPAGAARTVLDVLRSGNVEAQPDNSRFPGTRKPGMIRENAQRASRQRQLLARALRANETDDREGGRKAGRLDRSALSRASAGAQNVFCRREISEGFDTDVCILIDASGSMSCDLPAAIEMGLVIAQAAGSVGASCTTELFNSHGFARLGGLAAKRVPKPDDFARMQNAASGGTPLSFHMARAAIAQAKRASHKRRVLFVVTDGGCDYGARTVKGVGDYLEKTFGTVLAHVSIGNPLTGQFKAEVLVPRGTSIADVGLEHFTKVLQAL